MTARHDMFKDGSANKSSHSTISILISALVGALVGLGILFLIAGSFIHSSQPERPFAESGSAVTASVQPHPMSDTPVAASTNQQPYPSQAPAVSSDKQEDISTPTPNRSVVICIDPGHPSEVSAGRAIQNGLQEVIINWRVAAYLNQFLQASGYSVIFTKTRWDELVTNRRRAEIANECGASLLIRLHCDTGNGRGYTLYYPDSQGSKNGRVGPSRLVMRSSSKAAQAIHRGMLASLKDVLKDDGVKGDSATRIGSQQGALTGSIYSEVPTVTVEMVFLSSKADANFIRTEKGQQRMASALAAGIAQYLPMAQSNPSKTIR